MIIIALDRETLGKDVSFEKIEEIGELRTYPTSTEDEVLTRIKDAEVIIINKIKITKKVLEHAPKLKLICIAATGYDNVDIEACKEKNVAVCNVVGYSTHSVAQTTLALVLALSINLSSFAEFVEDGRYSKSGVANRLTPVYHELNGKTWGIIGYGNIGKQVERVATALGCDVVVNKKTPCEEAKCVDLETLCKISDIITIHTPLNEATRGMINRNKIAMMKKDVIIVNTARGAVTDEEAICDAVENGEIGAFATDVYSSEPFDEKHPFNRIKDFKNVYLTPHMAWGAYEARNRCLNEIAENIKAFQNNETRNRVDL